MNNKTPAVVAILASNVILFLLTQAVPALKLRDSFALFFWENPMFGIWQYLTSMFMHADFTHILFNMMGVLMFGTALEKLWGSKKFLILYFAAGLGAGLIQNFVNWYQFQGIEAQLLDAGNSRAAIETMLTTGAYNPNTVNVSKDLLQQFWMLFSIPMVGASGALYGVLVAYALIYPNNKLMLLFLPFPIAAKFFIPGVLMLDLFSGVTGFSLFGRNIAHFAHLGGALIGFLLMMYWRHLQPRN